MAAKWQKGMHVFLVRRGYGYDTPTVDRRYKYRIRSIGKKQAILDRILDPDERMYSRGRGQAFHITPPDQIQSWREAHPGQPLPNYYHENWIDIFVPAGSDEWDADENYHWS